MKKKNRVTIPTKTRNSVMREFNYRCAICGTPNPTIHHIDEDPGNNLAANLLPLCPNCHYLDQHDPTTPIDPRKLMLFRRHKDPLILSPQFEPLFRRITFLLDLEKQRFDSKAAQDSARDLVQFVSQLEMGNFYGNKLGELVAIKRYARVFSIDTPDHVFRQWATEESTGYFSQLSDSVKTVLDLVVELLRYQAWSWKPTQYSSSS